MTLEEALSKIADPEVRALLQKIINDQNKYVGQLESQLKAASTAPQNTNNGLDQITAKYLEKNMRRDVISEAISLIKKDVSQEVYTAVEPDYIAFLDKNMTKANTTVEFCADAFSLVLGKCLRNKEHAIHKVGKGTNPQPATPTQTPVTNAQSVAQVNSIIQQQAPGLTDRDQVSGSAQGLPETGKPIANTREAFSKLRERFANNGANKFQ